MCLITLFRDRHRALSQLETSSVIRGLCGDVQAVSQTSRPYSVTAGTAAQDQGGLIKLWAVV